jgi:RNA polymerase-binding transcription factor
MKAKTKTSKMTRSAEKPPPAKAKPQQRPRVSGKYESIRRDLMRQRVELLTQAGIGLPDREDQIISPDMTDQAQAEVDRDLVLRMKEREQKLVKKIDDAVERIDNGTFGICRGCGNEIPLPRLKASPITDLCIECKTRQEQDEIIRGRR